MAEAMGEAYQGLNECERGLLAARFAENSAKEGGGVAGEVGTAAGPAAAPSKAAHSVESEGQKG